MVNHQIDLTSYHTDTKSFTSLLSKHQLSNSPTKLDLKELFKRIIGGNHRGFGNLLTRKNLNKIKDCFPPSVILTMVWSTVNQPAPHRTVLVSQTDVSVFGELEMSLKNLLLKQIGSFFLRSEIQILKAKPSSRKEPASNWCCKAVIFHSPGSK